MYNANSRERPCLQRFNTFSRCSAMCSCMFIFAVAGTILLGVVSGGHSDSFYKSVGIAVLVIGVILTTLTFAWCHYAQHRQSNAALAPRLVQPPIIRRGRIVRGGGGGVVGVGGRLTFEDSYEPHQLAGSCQIGTNQYPKAQSTVNQYPSAQPTLQPPSPVERLPDQPPPTYNEVMNPTGDV